MNRVDRRQTEQPIVAGPHKAIEQQWLADFQSHVREKIAGHSHRASAMKSCSDVSSRKCQARIRRRNEQSVATPPRATAGHMASTRVIGIGHAR